MPMSNWIGIDPSPGPPDIMVRKNADTKYGPCFCKTQLRQWVCKSPLHQIAGWPLDFPAAPIWKWKSRVPSVSNSFVADSAAFCDRRRYLLNDNCFELNARLCETTDKAACSAPEMHGKQSKSIFSRLRSRKFRKELQQSCAKQWKNEKYEINKNRQHIQLFKAPVFIPTPTLFGIHFLSLVSNGFIDKSGWCPLSWKCDKTFLQHTSIETQVVSRDFPQSSIGC